MALKSVEEVLECVRKNNSSRCFLYFIASPDETGESWCPDCRKAKKPVEEAQKQLPPGAVFLTIHTGSRKEWKDQSNAFRLEPQLRVSNVPTLMEFGKTKRLIEEQLFSVDTILKYFNQ
ncbi:thioredoxin domain containing protein 17 [Echinococcus multilocularis]|uniref:Thioredoxin domain-containing protein 17 n=1 Tax=Echinococcus multilocularis TaxID=6211 RepID=A0A068XUF7_ECHMU|nr:thioredoxin domain containing protein 17 [Echinococcus multilocularis]